MSASDFTPTLRNRIISIFSDSTKKIDLASYSKQTRKQIFKDSPDTKELRKKFESKGFHNSSITIEGMQALAQKLLTVQVQESAKNAVDSFLKDPNFATNFIEFVSNSSEYVEEYGPGDYRIRNIPQDNLKKLFKEFLVSNSSMDSDTVNLLYNNVQSGHLAGVWFLKLKVALGVSTTFQESVNSSYRDFKVSMDGLDDDVLSDQSIQALDTILKAVLDADYLSSNLVTNNQVFVDATKSVVSDKPTLFTELQFTKDNKTSGDLLQKSGLYLNRLIKAAIAGEQGALQDSFRDLVSSMQPIADVLLAEAERLRAPLENQKIFDQIVGNAKNLQSLNKTLLETKGSPSYIEGIAINLANIISGKKSIPIVTKVKFKVENKTKEVLNIKQAVREASKAVAKVKEATKKLKTTSRKKFNSTLSGIGGGNNIASLQVLLNQQLAMQIEKNMGTGQDSKVLNYRTGRLAESAKVERISQSREGMITAFYTYMKNPYATFSAGGQQQYPRTRDPKLLISKSIREIGQSLAYTRMRAVNV